MCDIFYIMRELISFVYLLEKKSLWHSDIKPDNIILLNEANSSELYLYIRLIDFGCASNNFMQLLGYSPLYFISKNRKYVEKDDWYTFTTKQERT